jgi:hypothetical protein
MRGGRMNKQQKRKMLFAMELRWRLVVHHRKKVNHLLANGVSLSSPELLAAYEKLEKQVDIITDRKNQFIDITGEHIKFYGQKVFSSVADQTI